jgi:hypothetical protein
MNYSNVTVMLISSIVYLTVGSSFSAINHFDGGFLLTLDVSHKVTEAYTVRCPRG